MDLLTAILLGFALGFITHFLMMKSLLKGFVKGDAYKEQLPPEVMSVLRDLVKRLPDYLGEDNKKSNKHFLSKRKHK